LQQTMTTTRFEGLMQTATKPTTSVNQNQNLHLAAHLLTCSHSHAVRARLHARTGTLWEWLDKRTINFIGACDRFAVFVSPVTNMFVRNEKDGFMVLMLILQVSAHLSFSLSVSIPHHMHTHTHTCNIDCTVHVYPVHVTGCAPSCVLLLRAAPCSGAWG
jgi:hypothetical protein